MTGLNRNTRSKAAGEAYPTELENAEWELRKHRPKYAGKEAAPPDQAGFGLSGGGIRSATFCLGVFQKLADLGLLDQIDYLSSVSGGGYFASFLGRLFSRDDIHDTREIARILAPNATEPKSDAGEGNWKCKVFRWLRENGRYLSPRGAGDLLFDFAVVMRNWVSLQIVIGIFVFAILMLLRILADPHLLRASGVPWIVAAMDFLDRALSAMPARIVAVWWQFDVSVHDLLAYRTSFSWSPYLIVAIGIFVFAVLPCIWAYWLVPSARSAADLTSSFIWLVLAWIILHNAGLAGSHSCWIRLVAIVALGISIWRIIWACRREAASVFRIEWTPAATWGAVVYIAGDHWRQIGVMPATLLLLVAAETIFLWLIGLARSQFELKGYGARKDDTADELLLSEVERPLYCGEEVRDWLSAALKLALLTAFAFAVFGLVDSCSRTFAHPGSLSIRFILIPFSLLAPIASVAKWLFENVTVSTKGRRLPIKWSAMAGAVAIGGAVFIIFAMDMGVYQIPASAVCAVTLGAIALSFLLGRTPAFVNRSSLYALYSGRLTRAYLGASNMGRFFPQDLAVTDPVAGDDISQTRYWNIADRGPYRKGAPLHLVNVTINETFDGRSQVEQHDRKGVGMALGPAGISAGVRHHVVFNAASAAKNAADPEAQYKDVMVFPRSEPPAGEKAKRPPQPYCVFNYGKNFTGQRLSLGGWTGISGAAFSTGIGARTSLGFSLLAGFFNIRLGYWWNSGARSFVWPGWHIPSLAGRLIELAFPAQANLANEFLARFPGTNAKYWYLTDGGHFENLAAYELIRRRLKLIVVVDAGADPTYDFSDLGTLVRKARLDFGAEIQFLDERELDSFLNCEVRRSFGTLEQLRRGSWVEEPVADPNADHKRRSLDPVDRGRLSLAHAAIARICYEGEAEPGVLIYLKPTLTGDEPADINLYHSEHPDFPHETTLDQFFDEAQWESYRKLGEHIAERIFGGFADDGGFRPNSLSPRANGVVMPGSPCVTANGANAESPAMAASEQPAPR